MYFKKQKYGIKKYNWGCNPKEKNKELKKYDPNTNDIQ